MFVRKQKGKDGKVRKSAIGDVSESFCGESGAKGGYVILY